jgi:hypothetical protein
MREQTGESYVSTPWAKALMVSEAKVGKTSFLVAGALGVLPWQKVGGLVDRPSNLHVITFDANAAGGLKKFLLESCKAPKEALQFKIYNMQQDLLDTAGNDQGYDYTFFNTLANTLDTIHQRCKGVPVVIFSSLTGVAEGLLRGVQSPVGQKKGTGMDIARWSDFARQVAQIRFLGHQGSWHCLWEAHVLKMVRKGQNKDEEQVTESLQIPGQSGVNFPYNVEQVLRIRRTFNSKHPGSNVDQTFFDTRPNFEFIANGRGFNEVLDPKEPDLAHLAKKLELKVGHWGQKSSAPKK